MIRIFETSGQAYDACQCDETIEPGDVLYIPSEGVVGVADTWPVAVTVEHGKLHRPADGYTLASCFEGREAARGVGFAIDYAKRRALTIRS